MPEQLAHIRARVPEAIESEIMLHLNRLGGVITLVEREADSRTAIGATVPKEHVSDFTSWLQRFSGGQGSVTELPT